MQQPSLCLPSHGRALLLPSARRRYVAQRSLGGAPATSPLAAAAERATALLLSPLVAGMAGVLSLAGLLSDPEAEERARLRRAEQEETAAEERRAAVETQAAAVEADAGIAVAAMAAPEAAQAALDGPELAAAGGEQQVPAGRSPAEALQAAAAQDMAQVDMRSKRTAALRARKPPPPVAPEDLKPRHTARPDLTAAANALHAPPPPPVPMPPPVPEAAEGAEFDANVALSMQVGGKGGQAAGAALRCRALQQHAGWGRTHAGAPLACLAAPCLARPPSCGCTALGSPPSSHTLPPCAACGAADAAGRGG